MNLTASHRSGPAPSSAPASATPYDGGWFPGDTLEVATLGAIRRFPHCFVALRDAGITPSIFSGLVPATLALDALGETTEPLPGWAAPLAAEWRDWADGFAPPTEAGARQCVARLVRERACQMLPPALRWGADALERRWRGVGEVITAIRRVFDLAEGGEL